MKVALFTLFSFAVSALATPLLASRQLETQGAEIDQLTDLIKLHTANISTAPPSRQFFHTNSSCLLPII